MKTSYYPVFMNVTGKRCAVVGGGQVALRKVRALLAAGAAVHVISGDLCADLRRMVEDGEIKEVGRHYRPGDLKEAFLVVAATDDRDVNVEVAREARKERVLVNVVDDAAESDFIVPSILNRGDVTIAVSTSGLSPALARKIRSRLEAVVGDEYADLALLVSEVRDKIRSQGLRVDAEHWQEALDVDELLELLKKGDRRGAEGVLLEKLKRTA